MNLQTVIARYFEYKALVRSPKCASLETNEHTGEGRKTTLEDIYAFIIDCELALKDMGKWGKKLRKHYASIYLYGFTAPVNREHRILDRLAYQAFKKRGLLSKEYHE